MNIRFASEHDILKASRLWLQMVAELDETLTPNLDWWRKMALINMRNGNYFMLLADMGGRLIGFLDWFMFPEPSTSKLHAVGQHFFVLPEFRKSNVAGRLYKKAVKFTKKLGAQIYELFCFEKDTHFWNKHNFKLKRCLVRKEGN